MGEGDQWEIDSAAIGSWHVGNPPDWRAIDTMKKHDVPYNNCARQVCVVMLLINRLNPERSKSIF